MFRKMRGVKVPPDRQGFLFFTCRNYRDLPEEVKNRIDSLCDTISRGSDVYRAALFALLTTRESVTSISLRYAVGQTKLYDMRREFYETWYKKEAGS